MVTIFPPLRRLSRKPFANAGRENQPCDKRMWPGTGFPGRNFRYDSMKTVCGVLLTLAVFILPESSCFAGVNNASDQNNNLEIAPVKQNESRQYDTVTAHYAIPDVTLNDSNGKPVRLKQLLAQARPVLMQFIFTSCSTVCPLLSVTFSQAQREMARQKIDSQLISISIDPEFDTAERLASYAKKFHAGNNWVFLTGQKNDIRRVLTAFDALYQSDNKTYHRPLLYLHSEPNQPWTRFEGFIDAHDILMKMRTALDPA